MRCILKNSNDLNTIGNSRIRIENCQRSLCIAERPLSHRPIDDTAVRPNRSKLDHFMGKYHETVRYVAPFETVYLVRVIRSVKDAHSVVLAILLAFVRHTGADALIHRSVHRPNSMCAVVRSPNAASCFAKIGPHIDANGNTLACLGFHLQLATKS